MLCETKQYSKALEFFTPYYQYIYSDLYSKLQQSIANNDNYDNAATEIIAKLVVSDIVDSVIAKICELLEEYRKEINLSDPMLQAIALLTQAITANPTNMQYKILLILCKLKIGIIDTTTFNELNVKNIQFDTLSFINNNYSNELATPFDTFYFNIYNDNNLHKFMTEAFHYQSYSKLEEFKSFYSTLNNSIQKAITEYNSILHSFYYNSNLQHFTLNVYSTLSDNRDTTLISLPPQIHSFLYELKDKTWVKYQFHYISILYFTQSYKPNISDSLAYFATTTPIFMQFNRFMSLVSQSLSSNSLLLDQLTEELVNSIQTIQSATTILTLSTHLILFQLLLNVKLFKSLLLFFKQPLHSLSALKQPINQYYSFLIPLSQKHSTLLSLFQPTFDLF